MKKIVKFISIIVFALVLGATTQNLTLDNNSSNKLTLSSLIKITNANAEGSDSEPYAEKPVNTVIACD